jgi:hypothetical protein
VSLYCTPQITMGDGPKSLGLVEIQRVDNVTEGNPGPDLVSTYSVRVEGVQLGTVRHRYGDGAWRLLALASEAVAVAEQRMRAARASL